jgi:hypothetical protein
MSTTLTSGEPRQLRSSGKPIGIERQPLQHRCIVADDQDKGLIANYCLAPASFMSVATKRDFG